ncbi:MAG: CoA transferase [Acidobacteriota bacterium]|nr:CoA transferase [Acidobacteriota bacterium]MDE3043909.1 CoA transferase [Acidobacteriota bacterium]MDE3221831.1 CoA transferase [Acidobacteriota bacterium]
MGPLEGVKVIELAGIGPGPYACMLLADLGADVLRFERGDPEASDEPTWEILNRGRPSVALDLKSSAGRDLVLELCAQADVLVEGFRPGVAERLGVGPEACQHRNARLVYARMTGYGQEGPLAQRAGHDINYVGVSGALWPIGRAGETPVPPLNLVGDFGGGSLFLVMGVLAALVETSRSGLGQVVDAAMVDGSASLTSMLHSFLNAGFWQEERGVNILDSGAPFYDVYETKDARFVAVGAIEAPFYAALLEGLGLASASLPAQFDRDQWATLKQRFADVFRTKTRDEWTKAFEGVDACVTPVLSPREAARHRYNAERHVFDVSKAGAQPQPAPRFSRTPGRLSRPPTAAGAGTREGLAGWGLSQARVDELRDAGAFG